MNGTIIPYDVIRTDKPDPEASYHESGVYAD